MANDTTPVDKHADEAKLLEGFRRVLQEELQAHATQQPARLRVKEAAGLLGIGERSLRRLLVQLEALAPHSLPPTTGRGATRRHWLFEAAELSAWYEAARDAVAPTDNTQKAGKRKRKKKRTTPPPSPPTSLNELVRTLLDDGGT